MKKWKGLYLLKNNTLDHTNQKNNKILFNFITKITIIQWHHKLGHAYPEAINRLKSTSEKMKIIKTLA